MLKVIASSYINKTASQTINKASALYTHHTPHIHPADNISRHCYYK